MEQTNRYIEDISKDLSFIPEEHLATIRDMIRLIAMPYKEEATQEANTVNKELLQVYADKFRKGFKLLMKKDLGLNLSFQIEEKYTLLKLTHTNLEEEKTEIEEDFDLYTLLEQENLALIEYHSTAREQIKYKIRSLEEEDNFRDDDSEKASIFTEEGIYILDISEPEKWTEEQAIIDRRNLLGLISSGLPTFFEQEKNILTKELLQVYADKFRKGFKNLMKKDLGLDFSFQIENSYTLVKFMTVPLEEEKQAIKKTEFNLEELLKENDLEIVFKEDDKSFEIIDLDDEQYEHDYTEKQLLFDVETQDFYFLETSQSEKWSEEQATKDARDLLGSMVKSLPKGI